MTHVKARIDRFTLERQHAENVCVRSHAKVRAAIGNARAYLKMMEAGEDLSTFVWTLVGGEPILGTADDDVSDVHPWKWGNPLILKESLKNCSDYMGFPLFFKRLRYLIPYRSQYAIGALLIPFLV